MLLTLCITSDVWNFVHSALKGKFNDAVDIMQVYVYDTVQTFRIGIVFNDAVNIMQVYDMVQTFRIGHVSLPRLALSMSAVWHFLFIRLPRKI